MEMLWRFEKGTDLGRRVEQACGYFEKKYGVRAARVMAHPGDLAGGTGAVVGWSGGEVRVVPRRVVMAQHLVVTDVEEDGRRLAVAGAEGAGRGLGEMPGSGA